MLYKTPRLTIEKVNLKTDIDLLLSYHNDIQTMQWIPHKKNIYLKKDLQEKFNGYKKIGNCEIGIYKVIYQPSNIIIGEIGLFPYENLSDTIEVGYIIKKEYWNKGLGTELLKGILDYLSLNKAYNKIIARVYNENERSKALCIKMGFRIANIDKIKSTLIKLLHPQ